MSIGFTEIKDFELHILNTSSKAIHATVEPSTAHTFPWPKDYKFGKCVLTPNYPKWVDRIHNFQVRADDTWVVSLPKAGSTWMENIVWQLKNNLDFTAPAITPSQHLFEYAALLDGHPSEVLQKHQEKLCKDFDEFGNLPSPRIFKSHLPAFLLPKGLWTVKPKLVYVNRNPKDTAVSQFYHTKKQAAALDYEPKREEIFDRILNDQSMYGPHRDHILSYWQLRHLDNVLFMTYEELSADPFNCIKKISEFLKCSYDDRQLEQLTEHVSFENLRKSIPVTSSIMFVMNKDVKPKDEFRHCRKGKVGGYLDDMDEEYIKRFDTWAEDKFKDSDFKYAL